MRALPQEATFAATIHGVSALVLCKPILVKRANRRTRAVYDLHRRLVQVVLPFWVVDTGSTTEHQRKPCHVIWCCGQVTTTCRR